MKAKSKISIVVGLGLGDEGKGTMTDYLTRRDGASLVVRFNGGPQAAHHVVDVDGRLHCFAQFGSGMFVPGVRTYLAAPMLVEPLAILAEAEALATAGVPDALERLYIDENCVIVTPFHRIMNRMYETARGERRHGSCGRGVGAAFIDSGRPELTVRLADVFDADRLRLKLKFIQLCKLDRAEQLLAAAPGNIGLQRELEDLKRPDRARLLVRAYGDFARASGVRVVSESHLTRMLAEASGAIFEGAQGALLDMDRGFWPHVTASHVSFDGALRLLAKHGTRLNERASNPDEFVPNTSERGFSTSDERASAPGERAGVRVGVLRAYAVRHGPGPFVTEDAGLGALVPELHNGLHDWQGAFRIGWFDAVAARYALAATNQADELALTNLDRLAGLATARVCTAYEFAGKREKLNGFFQYTDRGGSPYITDILLAPRADRERQSILTRLLGECRPFYQDLPGWPAPLAAPGQLHPNAEAFVRFLESLLLGIPVSVVSVGPTALDKIERPAPLRETED